MQGPVILSREESALLGSAVETLVGFLKPSLELVAVLCVAIGTVAAVATLVAGTSRLATQARRRPSGAAIVSIPLTRARLRFSLWLAAALEFQLGADILATTVAPSYETLGKVGAIVVIRTFLNFFLAREIADEKKEFGDAEGRDEVQSAVLPRRVR